MVHTSDNRQFLRVATEIIGEVSGAGGLVRGSTRDISLKGMLFSVAQPFPEGSTCQVTLCLDGDSGEMRVFANGYVARSLSDSMAIEFTELIGLDSWEHLRSLVLFNAEEHERASEQFKRHLGLKLRP